MNTKKITIIGFALFSSVFLYISAGFYNNIHAVVEGMVYRSAQLSGKRLEQIIKRKNIKSIINLRGKQIEKDWYITEKEVSNENNVAHYDFKFKSHSLPAFSEIIKFIETIPKVEKPYLVHCWRGAERAGMASALILSIEKDFPIDVIKKQFSARFGVLFPKNSVGGLFFDQYEQWLHSSKKYHSRENLISFIRNDYIDAKGNTKFCIDSVSGVRFTFGNKASVKKNDNLRFIGWAYDTQKYAMVKNYYLKIGQKFTTKIENTTERPDVIKTFGIESKSKHLKLIGWEANFRSEVIPPGCYKLFSQIVYANKKSLVFDTDYELCIK